MQELIGQVADIVEEYRSKRAQIGLDYNVFTLMDIERREEETHEYMIYSILNYKNHVLRKKFIEQFLIRMGMPKSFLREQWTVEREHYTEKHGRLDLFFKPTGHSKQCVVVELKVDAGDQPRQLKRYEDYVRACGYQDYRIIYLTLDGRDPEEQSYEGMVHLEWLMRKSFGEDVLNWLESCMEICQDNSVDAGFIQQYQILLKKLTEEDKMGNDVAKLIKSSRELRACLEIEQALHEIKGQILYDFMDAIYHEMKIKRCKPIEDYYDCAIDYYNERGYYPQFSYEIVSFCLQNQQMTLAFRIVVDGTLQFCIEYFDEQNEVINNNDFKKKHKQINQQVENAITQVLNEAIRNNKWKSIIWKDIKDVYSEKYDFKMFGDNCIKLMNKTYLRDEAKRIASEMMYYIKEIKAILEE